MIFSLNNDEFHSISFCNFIKSFSYSFILNLSFLNVSKNLSFFIFFHFFKYSFNMSLIFSSHFSHFFIFLSFIFNHSFSYNTSVISFIILSFCFISTKNLSEISSTILLATNAYLLVNFNFSLFNSPSIFGIFSLVIS